ncbi:hypothetical protein YC2023_051115 [Brassica napus]
MIDPTRGVVLLINLIDYKNRLDGSDDDDLEQNRVLTDFTINHEEEQPDSTSSLNRQSLRQPLGFKENWLKKWQVEMVKNLAGPVRFSQLVTACTVGMLLKSEIFGSSNAKCTNNLIMESKRTHNGGVGVGAL